MQASELVRVIWKNVRELVEPALIEVAKQTRDAMDALRAELEQRIAAVPAGKDGSPGEKGERGDQGEPGQKGDKGDAGTPGERGEKGERGEDGKDAAAPMPAEIVAMLWQSEQFRDLLKSLLNELPKPADGKDGKDGDRGADGATGERGQDGKSITVDDVMPAVQQFIESMHAKWALEWERGANERWDRALDRMPRPKDGKDGRDGMGFDDLTYQDIDERNGVFRLIRGDVTKEFNVSKGGFVDRGVFREGDDYTKGDGCTWDGCYWLAKRDTKQKPCEGDENDWRMAVRKGRKGKDGKDFTPRPPPGPVKLK